MNTGVGQIEQVYNVSDALVQDCYYIASATRPAEADSIWYSLKDDVEKRGHIMFIYQKAGFVYGFISGKISANQSKIQWLFVDNRRYRRGIGQHLLAVYTAFCKKNNVTDLTVYSAPTTQARSFYQRNGFEMVNANYLMRKSLTR